MGSLLSEAGDLGAKDMDKAKVLNALFTLIFAGKTCLQESQVSEAHRKDKSKGYPQWSRVRLCNI